MKAIMLTKQNAHRISMVRRKDETCMPRSLKSDIHSICQRIVNGLKIKLQAYQDTGAAINVTSSYLRVVRIA